MLPQDLFLGLIEYVVQFVPGQVIKAGRGCRIGQAIYGPMGHGSLLIVADTLRRDHLDAWRKMTAAASLDPERRIEELDDDTLDQLKSLGYIQ